MATAADVKAMFGSNARGRPGRHMIDGWNEAHPDDPYISSGPPEANGTTHGADGDLFDDDMFPDVNPGSSDADLGEVPAETPPRRPKANARSRSPKPLGWFTRSSQQGKSKKKRPRVSTEELLGACWRSAAKLAAPLPPLQRTLRVQAPVAGILLEDAVKDTIVDPLLQPFARLAHAGQTVNALAGPPLWVTAISLHYAQRAAQQLPPHPVFMAVAEEGLRSGLMAWCEVSGPAFEKALRKEREFEEKYGGTVDDMIAMIFADPPSDEEGVRAEEEAIRRAQGLGRDDAYARA